MLCCCFSYQLVAQSLPKVSDRVTTEKTIRVLLEPRLKRLLKVIRNDKSHHPEQVPAGVVMAREEFPATSATEADCAARTAMVVARLSHST